jgi:hypothetical protein
MSERPGGGLRCRDIAEADTASVIDLLTLGFGAQRDRGFWVRAVEILRQRAVPAGFPRYGCLMESGGRIVGAILQIFSHVEGGAAVRCNFSSWWVMPEYRAFGALLVSRAFRHKVTYTNITPAPQTWPILEAQGYERYCEGRVVAVPALAGSRGRIDVEPFVPDAGQGLGPAHRRLLADHASFGCLGVVATKDGISYPFVFAPRRRLGVVGLAVLVYCPAIDLAAFAGPLGRFLLRRGFPLLVVDADGPIAGLPGRYFAGKPKYYRGSDRPRIGDQSYTERALFGS